MLGLFYFQKIQMVLSALGGWESMSMPPDSSEGITLWLSGFKRKSPFSNVGFFLFSKNSDGTFRLRRMGEYVDANFKRESPFSDVGAFLFYTRFRKLLLTVYGYLLSILKDLK